MSTECLLAADDGVGAKAPWAMDGFVKTSKMKQSTVDLLEAGPLYWNSLQNSS